MPCRIIAVANQKGGTGKTSTTLSLGVALARRGKRVMLVDSDPQGDLTKSLGWADPDSLDVTLANHIQAAIDGDDPDPRAGILRHAEGVDLMPANIDLAGLEMAMFMAMSRERLLGTWMSSLKEGYDYLFVDCPASLGIIPVNAFAAADGVLIPVSAEFLPAAAMTGLLKSVERVRRQINPSLEVEGILVTLFDVRNNLAREVERTVRGQFGGAYRVFDTVVPRAVSAAESPASGTSIFSYDGGGKAAEAFARLAEEVLRHG
ncbi:ParA family protein [Eggerthella timonensis]|uniref:ParA family protein n=1 Tax=Eggerthella timonensis TaxID=1871008 RepID=UPI000C79008A|nr:ParA family protein [Eggerthella timonensis]